MNKNSGYRGNNNYPKRSQQRTINTDFYNALIKKLKKLGGQITYQNNSGWFNPELTKIILDKLLRSVNVDIKFESNAEIIKENFSVFCLFKKQLYFFYCSFRN